MDIYRVFCTSSHLGIILAGYFLLLGYCSTFKLSYYTNLRNCLLPSIMRHHPQFITTWDILISEMWQNIRDAVIPSNLFHPRWPPAKRQNKGMKWIVLWFVSKVKKACASIWGFLKLHRYSVTFAIIFSGCSCKSYYFRSSGIVPEFEVLHFFCPIVTQIHSSVLFILGFRHLSFEIHGWVLTGSCEDPTQQ